MIFPRNKFCQIGANKVRYGVGLALVLRCESGMGSVGGRKFLLIYLLICVLALSVERIIRVYIHERMMASNRLRHASLCTVRRLEFQSFFCLTHDLFNLTRWYWTVDPWIPDSEPDD